jgi:hypothetical protein
MNASRTASRPGPLPADCLSFATAGDAIARFSALFHHGKMPLLWQGEDGRYYVCSGTVDSAVAF